MRLAAALVLLQSGTDALVVAPTPPSAKTYTLHDAAAQGDANAVELLLLSSLPPEARNAKASTPLHLAAVNGHDTVAELLLDHGASANAANDDGMTPLHAAVSKGQERMVELLLSRGAHADAESNSGLRPMTIAARQGSPSMLSALRSAGGRMDETAAHSAFWAAVAATEATKEDEALPVEVAGLLHHVFEADMQLLLERGRDVKNVTCMQPEHGQGGVQAVSAGMNYVFDNAEHANLPLREGRRCEAGTCCEACSRVLFPTFALGTEFDSEVFPELEAFNFNDCVTSSVATRLAFVRLLERIRRSIAHEYGMPLSTVLPVQAYSRKYVAGAKQSGGGGSEGDSVILHTDEATHACYHYSCVLYLSTQGEDFEGGAFVWNDPAPEGADGADGADGSAGGADVEDAASISEARRKIGRVLTRYGPTKGAAVIFSSGWENMHEVEPLTSGTRYAVPCFFTTEPVHEMAYDTFGGIPTEPEAIADDLQFLLLDPPRENPIQSAGRVKQLMMKWHYLMAPTNKIM